MWHELEANIYELASDRYNEDLPELKLFAAVVIQAAKEGDSFYFKSDEFTLHSRLLRLSESFLRKTVKKGQNIESSGIIWNITQPLEEDDTL